MLKALEWLLADSAQADPTEPPSSPPPQHVISGNSAIRNDACHDKTDLKVFVIVAWPRPSFFWCDTNFSEFDSADITDYILKKSVSCQKKDGCGHARLPFFWYDNDLKVCFLVTRVKYQIEVDHWWELSWTSPGRHVPLDQNSVRKRKEIMEN